jgi:general secretion pathway protein K
MICKWSNDGYVTLAVLVMLGSLAALTATLLALARPALDLARIGADDLRLQGLVEGGVTGAGYLLFTGGHRPGDVNGTTLHFGAGKAHISVADEGGRIDLNRSDRELLAGLFEAVDGSSMAPAAFADRIIDWRDPDSEAEEGGAEAGEYASAGVGYGPPNAPFRTIEELRLVLGLSAADFDRLAPYVTVYNLSGMVEPFSAARPVLLAVPDVSKDDLKRLVEAHGAAPEIRCWTSSRASPTISCSSHLASTASAWMPSSTASAATPSKSCSRGRRNRTPISACSPGPRFRREPKRSDSGWRLT